MHIKRVAIKGGTTLYVCRDISERKQAEQTLRRSEERLMLALESANMGTWDWHVPTGEMTWSYQTHRILGDPMGTHVPSFDAFLECVQPCDRDRVSRTMADARDRAASYETEFLVRGYDQVERWVMGRGRVLRNGKPLRMIGVFVDFSDRHEAERELRELSGRLIHAHEQERIRLSRDLHDDVAQRVGLLGIQLSLLQQRLKDVPDDLVQQFAALSGHTEEIGQELHRFSHELHPARLAQLGLEASIRAFCREVSETRHIAVDLDLAEVPAALDADAALCLYRIAQEALQNVVKHSGAARAAVRLGVEAATWC